MAFHIGKAPCDEPGERSPADHAYRAGNSWFDKGRGNALQVFADARFK